MTVFLKGNLSEERLSSQTLFPKTFNDFFEGVGQILNLIRF